MLTIQGWSSLKLTIKWFRERVCPCVYLQREGETKWQSVDCRWGLSGRSLHDSTFLKGANFSKEKIERKRGVFHHGRIQRFEKTTMETTDRETLNTAPPGLERSPHPGLAPRTHGPAQPGGRSEESAAAFYAHICLTPTHPSKAVFQVAAKFLNEDPYLKFLIQIRFPQGPRLCPVPKAVLYYSLPASTHSPQFDSFPPLKCLWGDSW